MSIGKVVGEENVGGQLPLLGTPEEGPTKAEKSAKDELLKSAMQKYVRRGQSKEAIWCASRMIDIGMMENVAQRMVTIAAEDIGSMRALELAYTGMKTAKSFMSEKKPGAAKRAVAETIHALCVMDKHAEFCDAWNVAETEFEVHLCKQADYDSPKVMTEALLAGDERTAIRVMYVGYANKRAWLWPSIRAAAVQMNADTMYAVEVGRAAAAFGGINCPIVTMLTCLVARAGSHLKEQSELLSPGAKLLREATETWGQDGPVFPFYVADQHTRLGRKVLGPLAKELGVKHLDSVMFAVEGGKLIPSTRPRSAYWIELLAMLDKHGWWQGDWEQRWEQVRGRVQAELEKAMPR
jgi:hypothetical protein